jgi:hypothetical protein
MDEEVLRLKAHVDQTRSEMRGIVTRMDPDETAEVIKTCARGELADLDERLQLLVGLLAVVAIFDLVERKEG